jgi:hypothetical protein
MKMGTLVLRGESMEFAKQCSVELEKLSGGHIWFEDVYFSLDEIKHLPTIIQRLNYIEDIGIIPFHISDEGLMEAYWCTLSIKTVDVVQNKNIVLLSEAGKSNLEEIEDKYIELWDYTYYEILKGDVKGFIESINRYVSFMKINEVSIREENDVPNKEKQGIYYEIF